MESVVCCQLSAYVASCALLPHRGDGPLRHPVGLADGVAERRDLRRLPASVAPSIFRDKNRHRIGKSQSKEQVAGRSRRRTCSCSTASVTASRSARDRPPRSWSIDGCAYNHSPRPPNNVSFCERSMVPGGQASAGAGQPNRERDNGHIPAPAGAQPGPPPAHGTLRRRGQRAPGASWWLEPTAPQCARACGGGRRCRAGAPRAPATGAAGGTPTCDGSLDVAGHIPGRGRCVSIFRDKK
jgi:hypothetical protein